MQIGFIGLGKMGLEMATRAVRDGHDLIGCDVSASAQECAAKRGIKAVNRVQALVEVLKKPCIVWLQTPPGTITNTIIKELSELLEEGDLVIDGGNSDFRDTKKTAEYLREKNIRFMDIGVSGGVAGAKNGCGMLIGGAKEDYERMIPFINSLAAPGGYAHCGGTAAGHYAKTIHNGVEYAIMQAYAEGYEMLMSSEIDVDVLGSLQAYQNGCSIRSHILEKVIEALQPDVALDGVVDYVADSGMGRWTVEEATRLKVPTPTISAALQARFRSQQEDSLSMQCIAALRGTIGGHPVKRRDGK